MHKHQGSLLPVRTSVVAVRAALAVLVMVPAAFAAEPAELNGPAKSVEIGILDTNTSSAKFGEYNGLKDSGGTAILGFRFGSGDTDGATRYRIEGTDLGLETRNLKGEIGEQGKYRLRLGYDELLRNQSDSYQTPFLGAGSGNLTLNPVNWPHAAPDRLPNISRGGQVRGDSTRLTAAQRSDFYNLDLSTKRKTVDGDFNLSFNRQWALEATARHQTKNGVRPQGAAINGTAAQATLPFPIDYTTNDYSVALGFTGEKSRLKAEYSVSLFRNDIKSVTFDSPYYYFGLASGSANTVFSNTDRFSAAPNNDFHQLRLSGDYRFTPTTKLVGDLSYGRNTQNDAYLPYNTAGALPALPSFDGKVITKSANLKLTARPISSLNVMAAYKYDDRSNDSVSSAYTFRTVDNTAAVSLGGGSAVNPGYNTPFSRKLNQINLNADYALASGQWLNGGYDWQEIERYCNNIPVAAVPAPGQTCVNVDKTTENTYKIGYRNNILETLNARIGYAYSERDVSQYNWDKINNEAAGTAASPQVRFDVGHRKRDKVGTAINWQATDSFALTAGFDFNKDRYTASPWGLQSSDSTVVNLDAGYNMAQDFIINAYATRENLRNRVRDPVSVAAGTAWTAEQADKVDTIGVGLKHKGLLAGKLALAFDASVSRATSPMSIISQAANTGTTAWGPLPDLTSTLKRLKLTGTYAVNKASAFRFTYLLQNLDSSNYAYNGLQFNTLGQFTATATAGFYAPLLPTAESAPNYRVHVIGISYIHSFQ